MPGPVDPRQTVRALAQSCLMTFDQCVQQALDIDSPKLHWIDQQRARFSMWCENIGIFLYGRKGLDHQLRGFWSVRIVLVNSMRELTSRLQNLSTFLRESHESNNDQCEIDATVQRSLDVIAKNITLISQPKLSDSEYWPTKEGQGLEAIFAISRRHGRGSGFANILQRELAAEVRRHFPLANEVLKERLVDTMYRRLGWLLHRSSQRKKNCIRQQLSPTPLLEPGSALPVSPMPLSSIINGVPTVISEFSINMLADFATSDDVVSRVVLPAPALYVITRPEELRFDHQLDQPEANSEPPEPSNKTACPICFDSISAQDIVDEANWHKHVIDDIDIYVCLFEDCDSPEKLYSNPEEWLRHMWRHRLGWSCTRRSHNPFITFSNDEYVQHCRTKHLMKGTDEQLNCLAMIDRKRIAPLLETCPLCSDRLPEDLWKHVGRHFLLLAQVTLRKYWQEEYGFNEISPTTSRGSTANRSNMWGSPTMGSGSSRSSSPDTLTFAL